MVFILYEFYIFGISYPPCGHLIRMIISVAAAWADAGSGMFKGHLQKDRFVLSGCTRAVICLLEETSREG